MVRRKVQEHRNPRMKRLDLFELEAARLHHVDRARPSSRRPGRSRGPDVSADRGLEAGGSSIRPAASSSSTSLVPGNGHNPAPKPARRQLDLASINRHAARLTAGDRRLFRPTPGLTTTTAARSSRSASCSPVRVPAHARRTSKRLAVPASRSGADLTSPDRLRWASSYAAAAAASRRADHRPSVRQPKYRRSGVSHHRSFNVVSANNAQIMPAITNRGRSPSARSSRSTRSGG